MGRVNLIKRLAPALAGLALIGCGHTQPMIGSRHFAGAQTGHTLGVEYVFDLNQFNYAPVVRDEIRMHRCFKDVVLTHDLGDPRSDYVVRANFNFFRISTYNGAYCTAVYLLCLPLLTGIPYSHMDGALSADFEVYRRGILHRTYKCEDVFWDERGLWSLYPAPGLEHELRRVTRVFLKQMMRDFFNFGGMR